MTLAGFLTIRLDLFKSCGNLEKNGLQLEDKLYEFFYYNVVMTCHVVMS